MSKETPLEALKSLRCAISLGLGTAYEEMNSNCDIVETTLKAFEVAKKVLNYYSFAKYHLKNAYQDG